MVNEARVRFGLKIVKVKLEKIDRILKQIDDILEEIDAEETKHRETLSKIAPAYLESAKNLIHYSILRKHDIRSIQKKLMNLGMSRLANSQGHVKASLLRTRFLLSSLVKDEAAVSKKPGLSIKKARTLLANHTKELLGYRSRGRRVRIMVTQPREAAENNQLVLNMVRNGMNCARINCAHDGPETWKKIIANVKKASQVMGRKVMICMDLAGPKIRTGEIMPGARVRKFSPLRDEVGRVLSPAKVLLVADAGGQIPEKALPVDRQWLKRLKVNDVLELKDTRSKVRKLKIESLKGDTALATCKDTSYIGTGTELVPARDNLESVKVGWIPAVERSILLRAGDPITIHQDPKPGEPAQFDEMGNVIRQAHVSCQVKEIFGKLRQGAPVLFDDGKIEGRIESCQPDQFEVRITRAKTMGSRLRAEKGINFPLSDLDISGLTQKDREDLAFIAEHADAVNFSFVNSRNDVIELLEALEKLNNKQGLSIILKIETRRSFDKLTEILLTAMRTQYIGVMIARGDLAVETGWDNIGWVQKEVLAICNAAHVPVVWATQVLENMAKKGLPSRSEITDAASSLKAECVMLNKGGHINEAIQLLDKILCDMEKFDEKYERMLPKMERFS